MSDGRIKDAQQLFWEIETLRSLGANDASVIVAKLHRMAQLHEEIAKERLGRQEVNGWIDLFAAITAWGEAGNEAAARSLLRFGKQAVQCEEEEGRESLLSELGDLESWLEGLQLTPVPAEVSRQRRRPPSLAARRPREWAPR